MVGDLRLAHAEVLLELADADALLPLFDGDAGVREVAAARPSAIMESILTRMGSERARPSATSRSTPSSVSPLRTPFSSTTPSSLVLTASPARSASDPG